MAVQYAFGKIVTQGLDLNVDAADPTSYPGTGTSWTSVVNRSITGSLVSCSFSSDFKGGIVFNNPSASVVFPGTVANYGTDSFTVEMAFRPSSINGIHYLVSKNSGSFPNWGVYLSGSGGSGKLFAEYRINASVSCSVSSSTVFVTGSVYQADIQIAPIFSASSIYVDGLAESLKTGNGGGSLTTTASLFIGNYSQTNNQGFSGSIYVIRTYSNTLVQRPVINYNTISTRFSKPPIPETGKKQFEILVVAGGGVGGYSNGGGGGAGGLQVINTTLLDNVTTLYVGSGATDVRISANNSFFSSYTSIAGGNGGGEYGSTQTAGSGGSGGGSGYNNATTGSGTSGQGNNGGTRVSNTYQGGGGGAGSNGESGTLVKAGDGGSGSYIASFATVGGSPAGWFAGGGGGQSRNSSILGGVGGIGGGGRGATDGVQGPTTGLANTGGGGGGGNNNSSGGNGGSGIVAIRYSGGPIALGGEITQSAGFTYHVFRTVGSSSFTIF
jgi:hypothetical protein